MATFMVRRWESFENDEIRWPVHEGTREYGKDESWMREGERAKAQCSNGFCGERLISRIFIILFISVFFSSFFFFFRFDREIVISRVEGRDPGELT